MAAKKDPTETIFKALGETPEDAKVMAADEAEGKPMLARTVLLKALWNEIISDKKTASGEYTWIEGWLRYGRNSKKPQTGMAAALERLLAAGADPDDLSDVVRQMQILFAFNVCQILDGEGIEAIVENISDLPPVDWRLFSVSPKGKAVAAIEDLHESWHSADPSGREGESRFAKRARRR